MLVICLVIWLVFSIAVGVGAANRKRFGFGWFLFAILISPLVAGFILLLLGEKKKQSRPNGMGSVEASSPFAKQPPKKSDWSKVAWTPEQAVKLKQEAKAEYAASERKAFIRAGLFVAVFVVLIVYGIRSSVSIPETPQATTQKQSYQEPESRRSDRETVIIHPDKNNLRKSTTAYWDKDKGWVQSTPEFDARMQKMCDPYKYVCKSN